MSAEIRRIREILGGRSKLRREVNDISDLMTIIRAGLPTGAVKHLFDQIDLPRDEIVEALGLRIRTFFSRMHKSRFPAYESDQLVRLARVYSAATAVFDNDAARATEWLTRPNRALGGKSPLSFLDVEAGGQLVENELGRLREGIVS